MAVAMSHTICQWAELAWRRNRLLQKLHPPLGVGEGARLLGKCRGRENHVGEARRIRHEQILHHEEFQIAHTGLYRARIGARRYCVIAHDVHSADVRGCRGSFHLDEGKVLVLGQLDAPCLLELGARHRIGDRVVAWQGVEMPLHIAGPLNVRLAAQRHPPLRRAARHGP